LNEPEPERDTETSTPSGRVESSDESVKDVKVSPNPPSPEDALPCSPLSGGPHLEPCGYAATPAAIIEPKQSVERKNGATFPRMVDRDCFVILKCQPARTSCVVLLSTLDPPAGHTRTRSGGAQ